MDATATVLVLWWCCFPRSVMTLAKCLKPPVHDEVPAVTLHQVIVPCYDDNIQWLCVVHNFIIQPESMVKILNAPLRDGYVVDMHCVSLILALGNVGVWGSKELVECRVGHDNFGSLFRI